MKKIYSIFNSLRPKHYIKNLLIFIPIIFNGELFNTMLLNNSLWGICAFCMVCSIVYIINDLCDYNNDRLNLLKKHRPLASGDISKKEAQIVAVLLSAAFLLFAQQIYVTNSDNSLGSTWGRFFLVRYAIPLLYLIVNIGYSFGLKNIPIIDIAIIASGFIMRVFYGGMISGISISSWVYLTIISGAFYLGLGKRLIEIRYDVGVKRECLSPTTHPHFQQTLPSFLYLRQKEKTSPDFVYGKTYTAAFLEKNMYMCLGLSLIFYSLSCMDMNTKVRIMGRNLLWTVPVVLLISLKYNLTLETIKDGDPINIILGDKYLLGMIAALAVGTIVTIYY